MVEGEVEIVNRLGLHARAAAKLVHAAGAFSSHVTLTAGGEEVNAKSILGLLLMAAAKGSRVRIRCEGADEEAAFGAVTAMVAGGFGEES